MSVPARVGWTVGLMGGLMALYLAVGWLRIRGGTVPAMAPTRVDEWVPFSLAWLPVYLFMLPMSWAPVCAAADKRIVRRWIVGVVLMYAVSVPVWLFWPVTVPRVPVAGGGFWVFILDLMRATDPPINCLPSMHVAVATFAALLVRQVDRAVGTTLLLTMPLIWYATMALDQHWFVDGLAGMLLALGATRTTSWIVPAPLSAMVPLPRSAHACWLAPFGAVLGGLYALWALGWTP